MPQRRLVRIWRKGSKYVRQIYPHPNRRRFPPRFRSFATRSSARRGFRANNIAPTQDVLGVRNDGLDTVEVMRWGVRGSHQHSAESIAARRSAVAQRLHRVCRWLLRMARPPTVLLYAALGRAVRLRRSLGAEQWSGGVRRGDLPVRTRSSRAGCTIACPSSFRETASRFGSTPNRYRLTRPGAVLRPLDPAFMTVREVSRRVNNANYMRPTFLAAPEPRLFE